MPAQPPSGIQRRPSVGPSPPLTRPTSHPAPTPSPAIDDAAPDDGTPPRRSSRVTGKPYSYSPSHSALLADG
jgi:hypothetical protein